MRGSLSIALKFNIVSMCIFSYVYSSNSNIVILCVAEIAVLRTGFSSRLRNMALREYPELPEFRVKRFSQEQKEEFLRAADGIQDTFHMNETSFYSIVSSSLTALKKPDRRKFYLYIYIFCSNLCVLSGGKVYRGYTMSDYTFAFNVLKSFFEGEQFTTGELLVCNVYTH